MPIKSTRALIGMPCYLDGKRLGRVSGAVLDWALTRLEALDVECGIPGNRLIPADAIRLIGDVSIILNARGTRTVKRDDPLFRRALAADGTRVGVVRAALIDAEYTVAALELSRGYPDDIFTGRSWVRTYTVHQKSGDVLLGAEGGEQE